MMFEAWMALTRSVTVTPVGCELREIRDHVKLRHLAALHRHGADAEHAIERRLQVVGGDLPQLGLRDGVGGEAVAEDGKCGEGEPVGGDARRGGQRLLHLAEGRIDELELPGTCSVFQSKKRLTSADPRLVVERTV